MDGSGSTDPDGDIVAHYWTQTRGPSVAFDSDAIRPDFRATDPAELEFELTVTDNDGLKSRDVCAVTVSPISATGNQPPIEPVGTRPANEAVLAPGEAVLLSATPFSDPEGDDHVRTRWMLRQYDSEYGCEANGTSLRHDPCIDRHLWYWKNGDYAPETKIMAGGGGYWVFARSPNVALV